jgi:hypothetical protein
VDWYLHSTTAPGLDLAQLYARRGDHELYSRDVNRQPRTTAVLESPTLETGAQNIACVVLATAVLALDLAMAEAAGVRAAPGQCPETPSGRPTYLADPVAGRRGGGRPPDAHHAGAWICALTPATGSQCCHRKVRQPVKCWLRLLHNESVEGVLQVDVP